MIFKWQYHDGTRRVPKDLLFMGDKEVGHVRRNGTQWRVMCVLPGSGEDGTMYMADFPFPGVARSTLELVAAKWVTDACLWRDDVLGFTMPELLLKD
ncbi:hypothetical protein ACFLMW_003781 [Salmonella enterica]